MSSENSFKRGVAEEDIYYIVTDKNGESSISDSLFYSGPNFNSLNFSKLIGEEVSPGRLNFFFKDPLIASVGSDLDSRLFKVESLGEKDSNYDQKTTLEKVRVLEESSPMMFFGKHYEQVNEIFKRFENFTEEDFYKLEDIVNLSDSSTILKKQREVHLNLCDYLDGGGMFGFSYVLDYLWECSENFVLNIDFIEKLNFSGPVESYSEIIFFLLSRPIMGVVFQDKISLEEYNLLLFIFESFLGRLDPINNK